MKIAVVLCNLEIAGAQTVVVELLEKLVLTNDNYSLILLEEPQQNFLYKRVKELKIDMFCIQSKKKEVFARIIDTYFNYSKVLDTINADIIFAHLDYFYTWIYSLKNKITIVQTIHTQPYRIASIWNRGMYRILRKKNLIHPILLSKNNSEEFQRIFKESHVNIIPNPICLNRYEHNKNQKNDIITFVFVARFHEIKNHRLLLEAFSLAEREVPNIRLRLVGDGELLEEEKEHAEKLGIIEKILFYGEQENVAAILAESDVCVISSKSECFPLCALEAMASGIPIIASAVGGLRDIVKENGILIQNYDEKSFAEAMVMLAKDKEKRKEMGNISYELSKRYDVNKIALEYQNLFRRYLR